MDDFAVLMYVSFFMDMLWTLSYAFKGLLTRVGVGLGPDVPRHLVLSRSTLGSKSSIHGWPREHLVH